MIHKYFKTFEKFVWEKREGSGEGHTCIIYGNVVQNLSIRRGYFFNFF